MGDTPLEWLERESPHSKVLVKMDKEFYSHLKEVAKNGQTSLSQMIRYVLAVETGREAPREQEMVPKRELSSLLLVPPLKGRIGE